MKRMTTTKQLNEALTNNLLQVVKAEVYHKDSCQTDTIAIGSFIEDLQFLSESGIFADCIGWHYEKERRTGDHIAECGRKNPHSENIVIVHLRANCDAKIEDIEKTLLYVEEE